MGEGIRFQGQVHCEGQMGSGLIAELSNRSGPAERTQVDANGMFEFARVTPGFYTLRIQNLYGVTLASADTNVSRMSPLLEVSLPARASAGAGPAEAVSVKQLGHRPSRKVRHLVEDAQRLSGAGEFAGAQGKLEEAAALDPECLEARVNLGAQYLRAGKVEAGIEQLSAARALIGENAIIDADLGTAYLALHRVPEAEKFARLAMARDPRNPRVEYLLGRTLATRPEARTEAIGYLVKAEEEVPVARLALATVYSRSGDSSGAIGELKKYAALAEGAEKSRVQHIIEQLESAPRF